MRMSRRMVQCIQYQKTLGNLAYGDDVYLNWFSVNRKFMVVGKDVHGAGNVTLLLNEYVSGGPYDNWDAGQTYYSGSDVDTWLNGTAYNGFSAAHKALLVNAPVEIYTSSGVQSYNRYCFLMSQREIGDTSDAVNEGERCLYFNSHDASADAGRVFAGGTTWWLRSPTLNTTYAHKVLGDGSVAHQTQSGTSQRRATVVIGKNQKVSNQPDGGGVYSLIV